jgi:electron transfer flavoprotein beta subunit
MNIVVCVKQTFDSEARILLNKEGLIDENQVKFVINPFDEYAVEEALLLKERSGAGEVIVVSADRKDPSVALRQGLAMGADRAVWVDCGKISLADTHVYAQAIAGWVRSYNFDLVLCGKMAIDDGASELPSRLAQILNLPHVTTVSELKVEKRKVFAKRDIDGGFEKVEIEMPCLVSAQKGLNVPRYPSMRKIMEARKKKVEKIELDSLGLSSEATNPFIDIEEVMLPAPRPSGKLLQGSHEASIAELLTILRDERKII